MHTNPRASSLDEGLCKLLADRTGPVDISLEGDRAPGAPDRLEHRREDLIAILQRFDAIAGHDRGSQQNAHFAPQLGIDDVVVPGYAMRRLFFRLAEIEYEDHDNQRTQHRSNDCPERQVASPSSAPSYAGGIGSGPGLRDFSGVSGC